MTAQDDRPHPPPWGNALERRQPLTCRNNPHGGLDLLVLLDGRVTSFAGLVALRYVPDKLLLQPDSYNDYLNLLAYQGLSAVEDFAVTVLQDVNNEVVPRWAQVLIVEDANPTDSGPGCGHRVLVEDRQPSWDNPALLSRLLHS